MLKLKTAFNNVFSSPSVTVEELREILKAQANYKAEHHYDEVFPGIFLGGVDGAKDVYTLKKLRITHVLNTAAQGCGSFQIPLHIQTDEDYYKSKNFDCIFHHIPALDVETFDLTFYFNEAADFIDSALKSNGRVYVHCFQGVSRSPTLVIVYLMIKQKMSATAALKAVSSRRAIWPNDGFLQQICDLNSQLKY